MPYRVFLTENDLFRNFWTVITSLKKTIVKHKISTLKLEISTFMFFEMTKIREKTKMPKFATKNVVLDILNQ